MSEQANLEPASTRLHNHLRNLYRCWLCVGVANDRLVVYYDETARPAPKLPTVWDGVPVEGVPTTVPTIG